MPEWKIQNREALLQQMVNQLRRLEAYRFNCIEVVFCSGAVELVTTDLIGALDWIANDIWWNESSNWAHADRVIVRST